jgi:ferredoxin
MAELIFNSEETISVENGSPIEEACEEAGVPFACSGGICGACIIEITEGMENLSPPTGAEINFLGKEGVETERMACQCHVQTGIVKIKF